MTANRITPPSISGISAISALSRSLSNPRVATLAKALDIDLRNKEQLAPALARAMARLDRASAVSDSEARELAADGTGLMNAGGEAASPLMAAAALESAVATARSLPASQVRAALRAYWLVAAL
jgi:hypothetical protein